MNTTRRTLISGAAALCMMPRAWAAKASTADGAGAEAPATIDLSEAINQAGRQRMLTQRAAKAWLTLALIPDHVQARRVLAQSMNLFDKQLETLESQAPTPQIKQTYGHMKVSWSDYKAVLEAAEPNKVAPTKANELLSLDGKVLKLAQQGTEEYEAVKGNRAGMLVNLAGRQRMLSQRMAKFYMSAAMGTQTEASVAGIQQARNEFTTAMNTLRNAPEATAAIRTELQLADGQWFFFDTAIKKLQPGSVSKTYVSDVFVTSENLLAVMDKVTGLYANLSA